ncbi:MAG: ferrous iron transport protein A [Clostridia bacterium]
MTLNQLPVGKSGIITAVGGEGALRFRLLDMGVIPKTKVTLVKIAPLGDPLEIRIRGYEVTIRIDDAKEIQVVEINETNALKKGDNL